MTIRDLLMGLCEKLCINLAAVDLFLVGGEKVKSGDSANLSNIFRRNKTEANIIYFFFVLNNLLMITISVEYK